MQELRVYDSKYWCQFFNEGHYFSVTKFLGKILSVLFTDDIPLSP